MSGKPQVLDFRSTQVQPFSPSSDAEIVATFCSDPRPREVYWEWGKIKIKEGETRGRFEAKERKSSEKKDCFVASLVISNAMPSDARMYHLVAKNDRGEMNYGIKLEVRVSKLI